MLCSKMHSDVRVLQKIFWIIFMCSIFTLTQQDGNEIRTTWNNRLYPTNSVYEVSPSGESSSVQSPLLNNDNVVNSVINIKTVQKINEEPGGTEEKYDDDYESENISESLKDTRDSEDTGKTHYETKDEELSEEYDSEIVYDDYDNGTNTQFPNVDVIDYTLPDTALNNENIQNVGNLSVVIDQIEKEREREKTLKTLSKVKQDHEKVINKEELKEGDYDGVIEEKEQEEEEEEDEEKERNADEMKLNNRKNEEKSADEQILIGEAVVSVVTTKSVVNGTFVVPTPSPMTTAQMMPPPTHIPTTTPESLDLSSHSGVSNIESTEDSIIIASVQTSRSISGAHYLPFNLNNEGHNMNINNTDDTNNKTSPLDSTESIIDKLDRVQSELSSGFLTGGFRTAGNTLQLDVLSEQQLTTTRKSVTAPGKLPIISKFIPRRQNDRKPIVSSTDSTLMKFSEIPEMINDQTPQTEKPKVLFKIPWPGQARSRTSTITPVNNRITQKSITINKPLGIQDISGFLPAGFNLKKGDETTEHSLLGDILARSKVNLSSLLPANYKNSNNGKNDYDDLKSTTHISDNSTLQNLFTKSNVDISELLPPDFNKRKNIVEPKMNNTTLMSPITTSSTPMHKTLQELFSKSSVDITALLPLGYEGTKNNVDNSQTHKTEDVSSSSVTVTTLKTPGGFKLVFPSRPGGRKAAPKSALQQNRTASASMYITPKIQKGWPTRTTTEFTGWPMPSTTPISIEKLLEAAKTATVSLMNSSIITTTTAVTTTTTSTTTSTTMRPTTPGLCEEECEVAGTIRIIGNTAWVPEFLDRNTREWQQLANEIEKEMNLVFLKSAILRKWYKNVRIDAFSQGSILVDYFIELQDLTQKVNTQELKVLFHDSLRAYNAHRWNETKIRGPMRLGEFVIDPKSTDFVVIPRLNVVQPVEKDDRLIPQWAIAVIVIGVGGLLFIIIFGVSVLVNRQNTSKLKPPISGMYGEEAAKNILHASHVTASHRSSQDYPKSEISTIWNESNEWREKSFESNSNKILVDGILPGDKKYNAYDSWRSEWNGYYYQPSQTSSKFAGYESTSGFSRQPPDYDMNF